MGTHESQCSPADAASYALDFMQEIKKKINETNHEKKYVISKQTLEMRGVKTVTVRTSIGHKMGHSCSDIVCRWKTEW